MEQNRNILCQEDAFNVPHHRSLSPFGPDPRARAIVHPEIWGMVARNLRSQLMDDPLQRTLDLSKIDEQGERLDVNEIRFGVLWDFDHVVRNARGTKRCWVSRDMPRQATCSL